MTRTSLLCVPKGAGHEHLRARTQSSLPCLSPALPHVLSGAPPACLPFWLTLPTYPLFCFLWIPFPYTLPLPRTVWPLWFSGDMVEEARAELGLKQVASSSTSHARGGRPSWCVRDGKCSGWEVFDWPRGLQEPSQAAALCVGDLQTLARPLPSELRFPPFFHSPNRYLKVGSRCWGSLMN